MKKLLILLFLSPLVLFAQNNYEQQLDKYMMAESSLRDFNGAVIVVQKGKTIYQKAFGLADREWNIPNTVDTKFRIGSVTKQFTSSCIMQLAEQGKLSVDDKLTIFSGLSKGDSITIHMLLAT
jgi:CubicO group peptidase (beta-lactamase class C family)